MALDQYSDLLTAVANWSGRSDLTSRIPEFIELTEAKMNRKLRTKDMETKNTSFSITGEYVAQPTGFGGVVSWYLNTTPRRKLELLPPDLQTVYYGSTSGIPKFYAIEGSNFKFAPPPNATTSSTLTYYLQVPALTVGNTTNWLLTANPDAYLYGLNAEAAAFAQDFATAEGWLAKMYMVLEEIVAISREDKWGGNSMSVRTE
jgi:hypothetical protein